MIEKIKTNTKEKSETRLEKIAILGDLNSEHLPFHQEDITHFFQQKNIALSFATSYEPDHYINETLLNEAQRKAQSSDLAIAFTYTPTEKLTLAQHQMIRSVSLVQSNLIVFVFSDTIMDFPWKKETQEVYKISEEINVEELFSILNLDYSDNS